MGTGRNTSRDGRSNKIEFFITTHFGPFWDTVQRVPPLRGRFNRFLINRAVEKMPPRPEPLSTMADYTSWDSLTDHTYNSRHLRPSPSGSGDLEEPEVVAKRLFLRKEQLECPKSTLLFPCFAQWFVDGFLRGDRKPDGSMNKAAKNTSTHQIDLNQLYGRDPETTRQLRTLTGGLLETELIRGEDFPLRLCEEGDKEKRQRFSRLPVLRFDDVPEDRRDRLFAVGSDRANGQVGMVMMNVLFLREHNRLARMLAEEYPHRRHPEWDDERLFQTARNILIVLLLKIVVEDYINHIAPYRFRFLLDPAVARNAPWHRPNWMAVEFNLLYRWHSMIPSTYPIDGQDVPLAETLLEDKDALLTRTALSSGLAGSPAEIVATVGLGPLFRDFSSRPAMRIGLFNTGPELIKTETESIKQAREVHLSSYNDYRAHCGFPRVTDFDQISGDPDVQQILRETYRSVDRVEFYPGLFAEETRPNSVLPSLMGRMVGIDAFSQALTNPLLAPRIFTEDTFTPVGMRAIRETRILADIVRRNTSLGTRDFVGMTQEKWRRT